MFDILVLVLVSVAQVCETAGYKIQDLSVEGDIGP